MPIDYSSILKQIDRNNRQGTNNSFFYLVDASDVDFRVDGFIANGALVGGGSLNTGASAKYIVTDVTNLSNILTDTLQSGIANNDIVEKRDGGWGIHLDVSGTYSDTSAGGAFVYSKNSKKFYYYNGTAWIEVGAGTLTGDAGAIRVDGSVIYARNAGNSVTGVASFNATNFVVGSTGHVRLGDAYQNPFFSIRDEFATGITVGMGTTFQLTGSPGIDVRVQGGGLRFANMGVTSLNGMTGAVTLTGSGFFSATGFSTVPFQFANIGTTGDRLIVATGPTVDPFRNYVRFGNAWIQTGVAAVAQGPQGTAGAAGTTGPTGVTGATGSGLTGLAIVGGFLQGQYAFPNGAAGPVFNIGYVQGPSGSTGTTGATGQGVTGFRIVTDGENRNLAFQYLFANGSTSAEVTLGNVRGPAGNNGAAGQNAGMQYLWGGVTAGQNDSIIAINRGATAIYIAGRDRYVNDQRPFIRTFDDSTSPVKGYLHLRPETTVAGPTAHVVFRITGMVTAAAPNNTNHYELRGNLLTPVGAGGETGGFFPVSSYVAVEFSQNGDFYTAETQTYTSHTAPTFSGSGTARKVAFLQADGSLTFDYVKTFDVFNPNEFQFAVTSFGYQVPSGTNIGGARRVGSGNINLSTSAVVSASYRSGTTVNAASVGIVNISHVASGFQQFYALPSPFTSNSGAATNLGVVGNVIQDVTIRLRATGQGSGDPSPVLSTSDITMQFRNEFLYGMTSASCLTGGAGTNSLTTMRTVAVFGGLAGDFSSTLPVSQSIPASYGSGYGWSVTIPSAETAVFGYFAIPKRIHNSGNLKFYVEGSLVEGGFTRQGEGLAAACGGTSTMSFTNQSGYTEDYVVYRSENPVSAAVSPYEVIVTR